MTTGGEISCPVRMPERLFIGGEWVALSSTATIEDFGISFGGYKQSGIGREGGVEGLLPFLETKLVVLEGRPSEVTDPDELATA